MRLSTILALLVTGANALGPHALDAQAAALGLRPMLIRPSMDTMRIQSAAPDRAIREPISIRSTQLGRGANAGTLVEAMRMEIRDVSGTPLLTLIDTLVMSANDLRLRRGRSIRLDADGHPTRDLRVAVESGALTYITTTPDRSDTTQQALAPGALAPFVTPYFVMRAAPLSADWRATYDIFVASEKVEESIQTVHIDSVRPGTVAARSTWVVHAHIAPDLHWIVTVDSATRDLVSFNVFRNGSTPATAYNVTYHSNRYSAGQAAPRSMAAGDTKAFAALAGRYYLEGVREAGSELILRPNGTFAFMLNYGALDEHGAGTWSVQDGDVVLASGGAAREPSVRLVKGTGRATDSLQILVVDTAGRPLSGMTIDAASTTTALTTVRSSTTGYTLHFPRATPPTEIGIGLDMVDFRVAFRLTAQVHAIYRFVFDAGDLGTRRFDHERLTVTAKQLTMTLNGRQLTYVRR